MAEDTHPTSSTTGLALYRKYRPASFAEVRGQEHVTDPLRQALKSGRINHAYLFSGPRGCGKTSSARIMARSLNCVNGPTPDPCGVCESCVALAPSGPGSIDVIEIDAASHGGVDDARDLRERAFFAPVSGRYKIYIIDEAHMVTPQGFNALLKLVEEPPPHLKFIFATTEPDKVIATIRSRTHHYPFRLMPPSVMNGLLTDVLNSESVPFEPTVIPLVVQAGGGSARDSLSILDQLLAGSDESGIRYDSAVALLGYTDASLLDEIVTAFAGNDGAGVFGVVNRVIEGGHEPRRFATDLLDRLRDLIVLATVPDAIDTGLLSVGPDRAEPLAAQAKWGIAQLTRAADIISNGLDQMRGATSPRLLLELMCAQVLLPAATTDERSLLARLERLESAPPSLPATPRPAHVGGTGGARGSAGASGVAGESGAATAGGTEAAASAGTDSEGDAPSPPRHGDGANAGAIAAASAPSRAGSGSSDGAAGAASSAPPATSAPSASPATSAPSRGRGVTAEVLRQDWPQVLEMIKDKRRVAWMMLQNASVVTLDENVLMLRFPRQGDVKGFTAGHYDEMLKQVLQARFGVNLVVRAISGPDSGPGGGGGPRRPAPAAPPGPGYAAPGAPAPSQAPQPGVPGSRPDATSSDSDGANAGGSEGRSASGGTTASGSQGRSASGGADTVGGEGRSASGAAAGGGTGAPAGAIAAVQATGSASSRTRSDNGQDRADLPPFPSDDDFDPDEEDMSSPASVELTGVSLIQRELGGEIIGEYED